MSPHVRVTQGDEATDRFLRILLQLAVAHCLASEVSASAPPGAPQACLGFGSA